MEKLADREAEIRTLSSENSELKNELRNQEDLRKEEADKIESLENAHEELSERLHECEDELEMMARENDKLIGRQGILERTCDRLEHVLATREDDLEVIENELGATRYDLRRADNVGHVRSSAVYALENTVHDLKMEVEHYKDRLAEAESQNNKLHTHEVELNNVLKQQEKEIARLLRKARNLEYDADTQNTMLEEQEEDLTSMKRMIDRLNRIINSQDIALEKKDSAILHLSMDLERYEHIIQDAESATVRQRQLLKAESADREKMMAEIEQLKEELKHERSGLLSLLGKGCGRKP